MEQKWHVLGLAKLLLHGVVIVFAVAVDRISAARTLQRQCDIPARSEEHHRLVESWKQPLSHEGHRSLAHAHGHKDSPDTWGGVTIHSDKERKTRDCLRTSAVTGT